MGTRRGLIVAIQKAVRASGLSQAELCRRLGLAESGMSRFMNDRGGLQQETLDALADLLGLDVVARGQTKAKGR